MPVLEQARSLADALSNSTELLQMREAETALINDREAWELWRRWSAAGQEGSQERDELKQLAEQNSLVVAYHQAETRLANLLGSINFYLQRAVDGWTPPRSGCSGGCCGSQGAED